MRIISSEIIIDNTLNGTRSITEQHTYDTGDVVPFSYITSPEIDADLAMQLRVENINKQLAAREAAELEANNFEAPITQRDFIGLFDIADLIQLRANAATNPILYEAIKYLELPGPVFKSVALSKLNDLVTVGAMQQSVVDSVMANWVAKYG